MKLSKLKDYEEATFGEITVRNIASKGFLVMMPWLLREAFESTFHSDEISRDFLCDGWIVCKSELEKLQEFIEQHADSSIGLTEELEQRYSTAADTKTRYHSTTVTRLIGELDSLIGALIVQEKKIQNLRAIQKRMDLVSEDAVEDFKYPLNLNFNSLIDPLGFAVLNAEKLMESSVAKYEAELLNMKGYFSTALKELGISNLELVVESVQDKKPKKEKA